MKSKLAFDDEKYNLWFFLCQVVSILQRLRERELGKYGLTLAKSGILLLIQHMESDVNVNEIARLLNREPHSVSELLSRMEKEGLLNRKKDLHGKYHMRIVLTKKGLQAYEKVLERDQIHRIMSVLSEEERTQLRSYLERISTKAYEELNLLQVKPY